MMNIYYISIATLNTLKIITFQCFSSIYSPFRMIWCCLPTSPKVTFITKMTVALMFALALCRACRISIGLKYNKFNITDNTFAYIFTRTAPSILRVTFDGTIFCFRIAFRGIKNLLTLNADFICTIFRIVAWSGCSFKTFVPCRLVWCIALAFFTTINSCATANKIFITKWTNMINCRSHNFILYKNIIAWLFPFCNDKDYFEAAKKRLQDYQLQGKLL